MRENGRNPNQEACMVTSSEGDVPSISRALNQNVTSGRKWPGWRNGRSLDGSRNGLICETRLIKKCRSAEDEFRGDKRELEFLQVKVGIGLLLGAFALSNVFAEFAGMSAIKSFFKRFSERSILGIADNHLCPGQRLKKCPMQTDGRGQSQCQEKFGQPRKHETRLAFKSRMSISPLQSDEPLTARYRLVVQICE